MKSEDYTLISGYIDKYLECNWTLAWFDEVLVVGSPPRSMTSLTLGS